MTCGHIFRGGGKGINSWNSALHSGKASEMTNLKRQRKVIEKGTKTQCLWRQKNKYGRIFSVKEK
jgi:hypothetical protein